MRHYCTYFDVNYLTRGLVLYRSLERHCSPFRLWVLCMDDAAYGALTQLRLPHLVPIRLQDFEEGDGQLLVAKGNRTRIEYYFTCTPSLPLYLFARNPDLDVLTYVDADLQFFASAEPVFDEMGDASILVIEHRFPTHLTHLLMWGTYNVGFLSFRRDEEGLSCLQWWRERCLEWCCDRLDGDRFADQKYLDQWPARFRGVHVLQHKGAGLAPWNVAGYHLARTPTGIRVESDPLIFFHFHGFRQVGPFLYDPNVRRYGGMVVTPLRDGVLKPYAHALDAATRQLADAMVVSVSPTALPRGGGALPAQQPVVGLPLRLRSLLRAVRHRMLICRRLLRGELLIAFPCRAR